jgi:hypothetical protein
VLADWDAASTTLMRHDIQLAGALGHLNTVLGDLDSALTPNTRPLTATVANLPNTIDHTSDFLAISTKVMQAFYNTPGPNSATSQAYASTRPGTNAGSPLQDGIALFPRLAQVMLGLNTCDMHIYGNGYYNVPGVTEAATTVGGSTPCPSPVDANGNATDPNLSGEVFGGHPGPNALTPANQRHLWRVMGMIETSDLTCGLVAPSTAALTSGACSEPMGATQTGFEKYRPSNAATRSSGGDFLLQLWTDVFGGAHA